MNKDVLLLISSAPQARFRGIARFAREHGWYLSLEDRAEPPTDWKGDGVLVQLGRTHQRLRKAIATYRKRRIPVVDLSFACPEIRLPRVCGDNRRMGHLAAEHFLDHGFRHAAFFASHQGNLQNLRFNSFQFRFGAPVIRWTGLTRTELADALCAAPKPLAVLAYSDYDASRVLNACRDAALTIPEEVAILGIDDNQIICLNQPVALSSIRHDHETVGYEGSALLQCLMNGSRPPTRPRFIAPLGVAVRQSTDVVAAENPIARRALVLIRRDLGKSFGALQIAEELGISPAELASAFKEEFGDNVAQVILRQRLARAKLLMSSTDYTLATIAAETGFCHAAHLANAFRKTFGLTPGDFRSSL